MRTQKRNSKTHPLIKLLRYRHFKSTSFLITLIIALTSYINSEFYRRDKEIVISFINKCKSFVGLYTSTINITGLHQLSEAEIRAKLNIDDHDTVASINIDELKLNLEKMPWIQQVTIRRILPNTLNIAVKENTPVAILQKNKRYYLINDRGQIIMETDSKNSRQFIILTGKGTEKSFSHLLKVLNQFDKISKHVRAASFISQRRWDIFLTLSNSGVVRVQLPQDEIERALQDLQKVMEDTSVNLVEISVIDVRQEGKVYLKYKNITPESKTNISA